MTGIDLGGHQQVRRVWSDYYQSVDAVVFMVDAADPARLPEAAEELKRVLADNQLISGVPIAVLANKVDAQVSDIISSINNPSRASKGSLGVKFRWFHK